MNEPEVAGTPRSCCPTLSGTNHAMWCTRYDRARVLPKAQYVEYKNCCKSPIEGPHLVTCKHELGILAKTAEHNLLLTAMGLVVQAQSVVKDVDWNRNARDFLDAYAHWVSSR